MSQNVHSSIQSNSVTLGLTETKTESLNTSTSKEAVLDPSELKIDELNPLEQVLLDLDHTDRANKSVVVEKLLNEHGLEKVAAAVEAVIPPALKIDDKQATLYQWLAELKTQAKLKYVGITHVIKRFLSESVILVDEVGCETLGGVTCRLDEIVASG